MLAGALVAALLLLVAVAFPVGWLKAAAERQLSAHFGTPVRIGAMERESRLSLRPVIRLADVHVAQAPWAGTGELAAIGALRVRLHLLPLLVGLLDTDLIAVRDARLDLVRAADGRRNWAQSEQDGGGGAGLTGVRIERAHIRYRDAVQNRWVAIDLDIDPQARLTAVGRGAVDGAPISVRIAGAPAAGGRWGFDAALDGAALSMRATGSMARMLRADDMAFRVTARADDLKRIDRVIEAGLFGTRAVTLAADVRHTPDTWTIGKLSGTIGRSDLTGRLTVRKQEGRTRLDGEVRFGQLDFDDLASEAGRASAAALERAQGLRLVPDTRVNIRRIDHTDGRIAIRADRVLAGRRPSAITAVSGVLTLDHRLLTADPLRIQLRRGAITGRAVVDQRQGQAEPLVTLALDMTGSSIAALADSGGGKVDARVDGRARISGVGSTIRAAVGRSSGTLALVARDGMLPEPIAALLGFDIGKGLFGDDEKGVALRCGVIRLAMRDGVGTIDPLLVDTGISQTQGRGTVRFPDEALDITLSGAPKDGAALRLPGTVRAGGTIRDPDIVIPKGTRSVRNILKAVGRALSGREAPPPEDADCAALVRAALR
ncbi:AsmA family protein [Sphingomonas quercus]|uniref:AsmA family protein n=1 Tax=Sphingomonas quercus TaxID=2842451 RepID=A0ABS6BLK3_9SPHN|nr:AsmA family protein [Sphingomonas quercus]MBU3078100.1 AsmA family protein [Sphingomonas quercus]